MKKNGYEETMDLEECRNCKCWLHLVNKGENGAMYDAGVCRRYPPPETSGDATREGRWTQADEWCGEWRTLILPIQQ